MAVLILYYYIDLYSITTHKRFCKLCSCTRQVLSLFCASSTRTLTYVETEDATEELQSLKTKLSSAEGSLKTEIEANSDLIQKDTHGIPRQIWDWSLIFILVCLRSKEFFLLEPVSNMCVLDSQHGA